MDTFTLACLIVMYSLATTYVGAQPFGQANVVYEWATLEFDWPSEEDKLAAIANETYVPERSLLAGIKVYKGEVYLTIPRWFWTNGHPVTLAKVVNVNNQTKLRPYPSWAAQNQSDCRALQYVQSMDIDPNTGLMYAIDTGRVGGVLNLCPAKIIVYDLHTDMEVRRFEMPGELANRTTNFLNDIVLDYVNGTVRYAYITDANEGHILVYDLEKRSGYTLEDSSMKQEGNNASIIRTNGKDYNFNLPLNGIAMSPDFKYVYYSAVAAFGLYQIPTSTLRNGNGVDKSGLRRVGTRISQTGGLAHGQKRLYYGALALNAVVYWDVERDVADQKLPLGRVEMKTQTELARNDAKMEWPDTFAFDQEGWLWFVSNKLHTFNTSVGLPNDGIPYMRVWKIYVNETGYLFEADKRSQEFNSNHNGAGTRLFLSGIMFFIASWISRAIIKIST